MDGQTLSDIRDLLHQLADEQIHIRLNEVIRAIEERVSANSNLRTSAWWTIGGHLYTGRAPLRSSAIPPIFLSLQGRAGLLCRKCLDLQ